MLVRCISAGAFVRHAIAIARAALHDNFTTLHYGTLLAGGACMQPWSQDEGSSSRCFLPSLQANTCLVSVRSDWGATYVHALLLLQVAHANWCNTYVLACLTVTVMKPVPTADSVTTCVDMPY